MKQRRGRFAKTPRPTPSARRLLKSFYGLFSGALIILLVALYWPLLLGGQSSALPQLIKQSDILPLQPVLVPTVRGDSALSAEEELQHTLSMSWRVLASSHAEQGEALQSLRHLRDDGFAAYPESLSLSDGAERYQVYVDESISLADAAQIVKALEQRHGLSARPVQQQ